VEKHLKEDLCCQRKKVDNGWNRGYILAMPAPAKKKNTVKAATPPQTLNFLKPKKLGDSKSKAAKKQKPVSHFPTESKCQRPSFSELMDEFAAADAVASAALRKVAEHKATLKSFLLENFARTWANEKERPATRTWKAVRSSLDYVMTSNITFTASKQEEIEGELGIDMSEYFEVTGFKIDLKKLQSNEAYFNAFVEFIGKISEEDIESNEFVERQFKLKDNFFNRLSEICDNNSDRLYSMLKILDPRANFKNVASSDKEEDLFDIVKNMNG